MARSINRLRALDVSRARPKAGTDGQPRAHYLADGQGLYLQITKDGARSWVFRYQWHGKRREFGMGGLNDVSLAQARQQIPDLRRAVRDGQDPIAQRKATRIPVARGMTFGEAAAGYIAAHENEWRSQKHRTAWRQSLDTYALPILGDVPTIDVDQTVVLRVLQPIWNKHTVTASRLRNRIELVLDYAAALAGRTAYSNPARWAEGGLRELLAAPARIARPVHYTALPWREVPAFITALRKKTSITALALRFKILTVARTEQAIGATWDEVDITNALWIVPAARMKAGYEHRVPLSDPAVAIVRQLYAVRTSRFVFAGRGSDRPLGHGAIGELLKDMGTPATPHGFRSSFSDWAADNAKDSDLVEISLAHVVGSVNARAYRRSDVMERRRALMIEWAEFCHAP